MHAQEVRHITKKVEDIRLNSNFYTLSFNSLGVDPWCRVRHAIPMYLQSFYSPNQFVLATNCKELTVHINCNVTCVYFIIICIVMSSFTSVFILVFC